MNSETRQLTSAERAGPVTAWQMKALVLGSEGVTALLCREHLPPPLHPFCWLGTLRPSDAASGLIAKLGVNLPPPQRARLESTKVAAVMTVNWHMLPLVLSRRCKFRSKL